MPNKAIIVLSEEEMPDGRFSENMTIDYEVEKDEEGKVIIRTNILGTSRIIFELFQAGILDKMVEIFVPAPKREPVFKIDEAATFTPDEDKA